MKQPFHAKDRVAAYVRKVVGAAAKGTGRWDSVLWPNHSKLALAYEIAVSRSNSWATLKRDPWWQGQTLLNRECEYLQGLIDAIGTHVFSFNSLIGLNALHTGGLMRLWRHNRGVRRNLERLVHRGWPNWLVVMTYSVGCCDLWIAQASKGGTKEIICCVINYVIIHN